MRVKQLAGVKSFRIGLLTLDWTDSGIINQIKENNACQNECKSR